MTACLTIIDNNVPIQVLLRQHLENNYFIFIYLPYLSFIMSAGLTSSSIVG